MITEPDSRDTIEGFEADLAAFVMNCPKLDCLHNVTESNGEDLLSMVIPRVRHLSMNSFNCDEKTLTKILSKANRLESFLCRQTLSVSCIEELNNIPGLVSLSIPANYEAISHPSMTYKSWKGLSLWPGHETSPIEFTTIQRLVRLNGATLETLELSGFTMTIDELMAILSVLTTKLRKLTLDLNSQQTMTPPVSNTLCSLRSIEYLSISNIVLTEDQFTHILNSLQQLRELHLIGMNVTPVMREVIIQTASRSLNRNFYCFLDHRFVGQAADRLRDTIVTLRNLTFIYCH